LVLDARSKWFNLGFQLDIKLVELEVIEMNRKDVIPCFREMLSTWLNMIDPLPSWERLLTALEHESVKCGGLAESIRQRFGIPKPQSSAPVTIEEVAESLSSTTVSAESGEYSSKANAA
jgi:hypothetical protein